MVALDGWCVVNWAQQPQKSVQEQACAIKAAAFSPSFFLYFLFVSVFTRRCPAPAAFSPGEEDDPGRTQSHSHVQGED